MEEKNPSVHLIDQNNDYSTSTSKVPSLIKASAPGKFILSGEYSVVYGKHAVALSTDLRTTVYIRPNNNNNVSIELKSIKHKRLWHTNILSKYNLVENPNTVLEYKEDAMLDILTPLMGSCHMLPTSNLKEKPLRQCNTNDKCANDAIVSFLLLYIGLTDSYFSSIRPSVDVVVESQLPMACGLGSSSAYSIALCGALMRLINVSAPYNSVRTVSNWAFAIDKYFHGTPSGIDNNIIAYGGSILFQDGLIKQHKYGNLSMRAILVDTCVTRSTKTLCKKVADKMADPSFDSQELFNNMDKITLLAWEQLTSNDFDRSSLDLLLSRNQRLLEILGVGHEALEDVIDCCSKQGFTAKLTGAGGGGIAFLLVDDTKDKKLAELKSMLISRGYKYYETNVGGDGLSVS